MTLQNLLSIGLLKEHPPNAEEIQQLLAAARRNIADSRVGEISPETRFDAAYKGIMQASLAALMAHGFRPDTGRPGHHMTVIQSLTHTISLPAPRMRVLDVLRRTRNLSDYTGEDVDDSSAETCAEEAERLIADVSEWIRKNRPDLGKAE